MKHIRILFLTLLFLYASPLNTEKEIYKIIIHALFPHKQNIKIWFDDPNSFAALLQLKDTVLTQNPKNADMLFISHEKSFHNAPAQKIIFVNNYTLLKKYQNRAIGGFFWQKGRPNIVFMRKSLQKHHIALPPNLQKYIEDEL